MPYEGVKKLHRDEILSYDELFHIAQASVAIGIEKIRITGGEPLLRKGLTGFIARLSQLSGLSQLVLTTNGLLLEKMAEELKASGIQRLNISLDSLKPEVFAKITNGGDLAQVMAGIDAAERTGFPIKINMVVMRGINDTEVEDFAAMAVRKPFAIRFIEYMPAIKEENWQELIVPSQEILSRVGDRFRLSPIVPDYLAGPAKGYRIEDGVGSLGFISPLSGHFCGSCNRIRLTSTGKVRSCLFSEEETDLKPYVRGFDLDGLREALRKTISVKPCMHAMTESTADHSAFHMSRIGG
jgi:cyclic pyranopterin phosphate synthase